MPGNARLFLNGLMRIDLNRHGISTEADIAWL